MAIEFEQYLPYDANTGDRPTINGVKWDCVSPCVIVGRTIKDNIPVVKGPNGEPKLNSGELLRTGILRTWGKSGQTPIEVVTLGVYQRISIKYMVGTTIIHARSNSCGVLLINDAKNFVKMTCSKGYDDGMELEWDALTLQDLRCFGLINDDVWETHKAQQKQATQDGIHNSGQRLLKRALTMLPIAEAKRIIDAKFAKV